VTEDVRHDDGDDNTPPVEDRSPGRIFEALLSSDMDDPACALHFVDTYLLDPSEPPGGPLPPESLERMRAAALVARKLYTALCSGHDAHWLPVLELAKDITQTSSSKMKRRAVVAQTVLHFAKSFNSRDLPGYPDAQRERDMDEFIEYLEACHNAFGQLRNHRSAVVEIARAMSERNRRRISECRAAARLSILVGAFDDREPLNKVQQVFEAAYAETKRKEKRFWEDFFERMRPRVREIMARQGSGDPET
jgi:hypothetical protein